MPVAHTEQFGDLEYTEDATLLFPRGLPGFEQTRRFVILDQPDLSPLIHLQSLEAPDLCFLALPIHTLDPDYDPALTPEDQQALSLPFHKPATLLLALLSVATDGSLTANLLAPIVVNLANRSAVQAVRTDTRYSHQHPVGEVSSCS